MINELGDGDADSGRAAFRTCSKRPTSVRYTASSPPVVRRVSRAPSSIARSAIAASASLTSGTLRPDFCKHRRELGCQSLRSDRLRSMLVNHAASRRLERRGNRARGLCDIVIDKAGEPVGRMPRDCRVEQEEELVLPFGEVANAR
jgi:hypothetical protein